MSLTLSFAMSLGEFTIKLFLICSFGSFMLFFATMLLIWFEELKKFISNWICSRKAKNNTTIEMPKPIQFNIKREPIRLTFDNIEYFEIRNGEVVCDKFKTDLVKFKTVPIPIIGSCGSYQYKKIKGCNDTH